jgi:hypothetical protein
VHVAAATGGAALVARVTRDTHGVLMIESVDGVVGELDDFV